MKLTQKKANELLESQGTSIVIPEGYTHINDGVFRDSGIKEVALPEGLRSIGEYAFSWCNIEEITFPNSLRWIQHDAFRSNKLTNIDFGSGIEQIDGNAFADNKLKKLSLPSHVQWGSSIRDSNMYIFSANPLKKVFYEAGSPTSYAVAEMDLGGAKLVARKIKSINSFMDIKYKKRIKTYNLLETPQIGYVLIGRLIAGTENSDEIIGSNTNEIIAGGGGRNILQGNGGTDAFLFDESTDYGKDNADVILDFLARKRPGGNDTIANVIYLSENHFSLQNRCEKASIGNCKGARVAKSKSNDDLKALAKTDVPFVYDKIEGYLFFNENGSEDGWGNGGEFIQLLGAPKVSDFDFRTF